VVCDLLNSVKKTIILSIAFITTGKPLEALSQRTSHHSCVYILHKRACGHLDTQLLLLHPIK